MQPNKKRRRTPLLNPTSGELFVSLFGTDLEKQIAHLLFVEGYTNKEVADEVGYSKRQIERIRINMLKVAVQKLLTLLQKEI